MDYRQKYLKYKAKYVALKNMMGGDDDCPCTDIAIEIRNNTRTRNSVEFTSKNIYLTNKTHELKIGYFDHNDIYYGIINSIPIVDGNNRYREVIFENKSTFNKTINKEDLELFNDTLFINTVNIPPKYKKKIFLDKKTALKFKKPSNEEIHWTLNIEIAIVNNITGTFTFKYDRSTQSFKCIKCKSFKK